MRAEAERTEARLREGAAELARGEALKAEKRAAAAAAGSARAELSPAVLGELEAAIDHMALTQAAERARLADAVSRLVLRVEEHRRGVAARLTAAAANAIAFKDGVRLGEAERAARLAAPLALAATPAAASASIAAGASMIIAAGGASALMAGGGGAGTPAAARRAPAGGRATPAAEPAPFSSPAAAALARHRGGAAGTPGGGLSVRQL